MEKLVITPKEDKAVTMTIRIDKVLQEAYNDLSAKTNRSRNELICVFCQVLFPKKSVKIPCFHLGKFPAFGGHTHASRRMSACSIR